MRGAAAVVAVVVAAEGCGLECGRGHENRARYWLLYRDPLGFKQALEVSRRLLSRERCRVHVSSVQAVEFREAESPSPEDCFVCARRSLWLQVAVHVGLGGNTRLSRLSDKAQQ